MASSAEAKNGSFLPRGYNNYSTEGKEWGIIVTRRPQLDHKGNICGASFKFHLGGINYSYYLHREERRSNYSCFVTVKDSAHKDLTLATLDYCSGFLNPIACLSLVKTRAELDRFNKKALKEHPINTLAPLIYFDFNVSNPAEANFEVSDNRTPPTDDPRRISLSDKVYGQNIPDKMGSGHFVVNRLTDQWGKLTDEIQILRVSKNPEEELEFVFPFTEQPDFLKKCLETPKSGFARIIREPNVAYRNYPSNLLR